MVRRPRTYVAALATLMLVLSSVFAGAVAAETSASVEEDAPRAVQQTVISGDYICKNLYTNQLSLARGAACSTGEMLIQVSASLPFDYCYSLYTGIMSDDLYNNTCAGMGSVYVEIDGLSSFFACVNPYTGRLYHTTAADGCAAGQYTIGFIDLRGDITKYACVEDNLNPEECDVIPGGGPQNEIRQLSRLENTSFGFQDCPFQIEFGGESTGFPSFSCADEDETSPAAIQAALESLSTIGAGNVIVTSVNPDKPWVTVPGEPLDDTTVYRVEFVNALGAQDITDEIVFVPVASFTGGFDSTVIDGTAAASPGLNQVMPDGFVEIYNATAGSDPDNPATYGGLVASGPVDATGRFDTTDLTEGFYVVCADGTGSVSPSCELVEINDNELHIVNNVDLPGTISAAITNTVLTNEVQTITQCSFQCNPSAGTITITFDGQTTAPIPGDATKAQVQTALENLSNVNAGDILVTGDDFAFGINPGHEMIFEFVQQFAGADVPEMTVTVNVTGNLVFYDVETVTEGSGAVQTLTADARTSGGTFTLSYFDGTTNSTTGPLDFDATAAEIETALNALPSISNSGSVVVIGGPINDAPVEVNFSGVTGSTTTTLVVDNTNLE